MQTIIQKKVTENTQEFYAQQFQRRRSWNVVDVSPNQKIVDGSEATLSKALAMSQLEICVMDWINNELSTSSKVIDDGTIKLLRANASDEIKHDQALNNLRKAFPVRPEDDSYVTQMAAEAIRLAGIYSPITVAGTIEASLFFVILPMYRFLGGSGFRTVANDISNDENIHVATHVQLAKDLGYRRGKQLKTFVQDVAAWLTSDLKDEHENKYLSGNFWKRSSNDLYTKGLTKNLVETKRAVMPSFFEKDNRDLPVYG